MRTLIALCILCTVLSGCQLDVQGPSFTSKWFYETENGGDIYKSRGSGMSGGNSYASDGGRMTSTGDAGKVYYGNAGDRWCQKYIGTGARK